MEPNLKTRTVKALKWNIIDRISTQLLYAVTGIVLARELSQEAFGLIGALLIFQSFALLMVDSGFSFALIQRKSPDDHDYSTVFWFNLIIAVGAYIVLWFLAPVISGWFGHSDELIDLGRVMFLSFIINALAIVQTNRLMKQMNVRPIAIANFVSLITGGIVGIVMAIEGFDAWAIVCQTLTLNAVKTIWLWVYCRWVPLREMSISRLKGFFKVGSGMMGTSFLNILFQNIYSFFIGNRAGLVPLGYYTQADKWSKMGVTSLTQIITSTFLPTLSEVQDDRNRFARIVSTINRATAMLVLPGVAALVMMAPEIFHIVLGTKWDASIILFQLLLVRGVFTITNTLYNNYMLALGNSKSIFRLELMRDLIALLGIVVCLPYIALTTPDNPVIGLKILLYGQIFASAVTTVATLVITSRVTGISILKYMADCQAYLFIAGVICLIMWMLSGLGLTDISTLALKAAVYIVIMAWPLYRLIRSRH